MLLVKCTEKSHLMQTPYIRPTDEMRGAQIGVSSPIADDGAALMVRRQGAECTVKDDQMS